MAVDSRNKRASCLTIALPLMGTLGGNPDGTIAQADRQQCGYIYAGIAVGSALPPPGLGRRKRRHFGLYLLTAPPQVYAITLPIINHKV